MIRNSAPRQAVVPIYLFACLLLGGSSQAVWGNMILQLIGIGLLSWAAIARPAEPLASPARQLLLLVAVGILVAAVQFIPLPWASWSSLGPRADIAADVAALGIDAPSMALSLTPYAGLNSLLALIPPLAIGAAMLRLRAFRPAWLVAALATGTLGGIMLGALQVTSTDPMSPYYLYRVTNRGVATGFFANANHFAILLVTTLPFLAAMAGAARDSEGDGQRFRGLLSIAGLLAAVIIVGIVLNRSLAAAALLLPVLGASLVLVLRTSNRVRRLAVAGAGILLLGGIAALGATSINDRTIGAEAETSIQSRAEINAVTFQAIGDFFPLGSGLGSFRPVYAWYEDQEKATTAIVNLAHNDYAQLVLELGLAGALLIAAFLIWWVIAVVSAWRSAELKPYVRAASIASAAILAHSIVDFPLRTEAMLAVFAMCLAFLADRAKREVVEPSDIRPTRHATLD